MKRMTHSKRLAVFFRKATIALSLLLCSNIILAQPFTPGETYYDTTGFVKYLAGNLPIIISAPHGGSLKPDTIPDRDCSGCSYLQDQWTKPIAEGLYEAIYEQTGCYPHLIVNLLHRVKFDANRDIGDAADGNPIVEQAWYAYHTFIDSAKAQVNQDFARGIFLDVHGHAHDTQRIELGYLLSGSELRLPDATLNTNAFVEESSIRTLVGDNLNALMHAELLRGPNSLGSLLGEKGFRSVPSLAEPYPELGEPYFSGGYNTVRHGSRDNGGAIDAVQLELNRQLRTNSTQRAMFIDSLPLAVNQYLNFHYDEQYENNYCQLVTSLSEEVIEKDIEIFPNPATDFFELKSDLEQINVSIYNCLGQKVNTQIWSGLPLDISFLERGYYFVQLEQEELLLGARILIKY